MKATIAILLVSMMLTSCATWSRNDKLLAVMSCTAAAADAYTTTRFLKYPDTREINPLMGDHPSDARVYATIAATQALFLIIANYLPPDLRKLFLGGKTMLNTGLALHNYDIIESHK
jgi:hypothetical protein